MSTWRTWSWRSARKNDAHEPAGATKGGKKVGGRFARKFSPVVVAADRYVRALDTHLHRHAYVSRHTVADIETEGMTPILASDDKVGVLVWDHKDGRFEATGLFRSQDDSTKGDGLRMLDHVVKKHGVNYVECFGPGLPRVYAKLGFINTDVFPFDPAQAPANWDYAKDDSPEYHLMKLTNETAARKDEPPEIITTAQVDAVIAAVEDGSLRKEIEATLDPEWVRKYGDAAWQAVLDTY